MPREAPRHNEGDSPQEKGGNMDSTQVEDLEKPIDDGMETEGLRVQLRHFLPFPPKGILK